MANTLKLRGGTTVEVAAATLAEREIMVDTTKDVIVVGPSKNEMAVGNGGTYTGNYTFTGDVTINGVTTLGSSINANTTRIQNVGTPTSNSDATTKAYVDGQITTVLNTTLPGNVFSADNTILVTDNNPGLGDIDLGIKDNSISAIKLQAGCVTTAKLGANSVTGAKFADNSITSLKLQDQAVTANKLAVDSVVASKIQAAAVSTTKIQDSAVNADKLANASVITDRIQDNAVTQAKINGLTSTITELNQLDAKTLVPGTVTWNDNAAIPSAAQINSFVVSVVDAVGGFVAIPDENSFPVLNPDPSNGAGTVVSIADAGGLVIDASGNGAAQTTAGVAVTISGFPASMYSTTVSVGLGLQVQTTTTLNTYNYHKIIAKDADVVQLSSDIDDFKARYRLGTTDPSSNNDDGDLFYNTTNDVLKIYNGTSWVGAAAGNAAQVTNAPSGNLAATNVQLALDELQTDVDTRMPKAGGVFTGSITTTEVSVGYGNDLKFMEEAANGTSAVKFRAPASIASDVVLTLPSTFPGTAGYALVSDLSGNLSWAQASNAQGGGNDQIFIENDQVVTTSYSVNPNKNVMSVGPITVNAGVTVTIPASSLWVVI